MGSNPISVNRKIGRVVKYNRIDELEKNWEIYNHLESIGLLPILRFLRLYIIDTFEDMARLKLSECVNFYLKEI